MREWEKREAGKLGSWEVKKCLWHGVPFLVLSALRHIREKMEVGMLGR
jgi:hypothetical protein